ncbi:hypothetical protein MASR1M45_05360 [Candidatus Kapaibacterium sp.]
MKKLIILVFASIFTMFTSCKQEQPTQLSPNYDKHNIQNDTNWVEVTDTMSIDIKCLNGDLISHLKSFVIRDSIEYTDLDTLRWNYFECIDYELPTIDFTQYTLLGLNTRTGPVLIERSVFKNDSKKKYLYLIKLKITNLDEILIHNSNFLLIPKIPDNFTINMDTLISYDFK